MAMQTEESIMVNMAESGVGHTVKILSPRDMSSFTDLTQQISQLADIPQKEIIILAGPPFKSYSRSLPPAGHEVYVYDRRSLQGPNAPGTANLTDTVHVKFRIELPSTARPDEELEALVRELQATDTSPSPLVKTLPHYETSFMHLLAKAQVYHQESQKHLSICEAWLQRHQRQQRALHAAVMNLQDHFADVKQQFDKLRDGLGTQQERSGDLLDGFPQALARLQGVELHEAFQSEGLRTLLDCVPAEKYEVFVQQCRMGAQNLAERAETVAKQYNILEDGVKREEQALALILGDHLSMSGSSPAPPAPTATASPAATPGRPVSRDELAAVVTSARDTAQSQADLVRVVEKDYSQVRELVMAQLQDLQSMMSSVDQRDSMSSSMRNVVHDLDDKHNKAKSSYLPQLEANSETMCACGMRLASAIDTGAASLRSHLWAISQLQQQVVQVKRSMKLQKEALGQLTEDFGHVELVHQLPNVYIQFVGEIRRRSAAADEFKSMFHRLVDRLTVLQREERAARETFLQDNGKFLPPCFSSTFLPSLYRGPPKFHCERDSDPQLPDLAPRDPGATDVLVNAEDEDDPADEARRLQEEVLRLQKRVAELEQRQGGAQAPDPATQDPAPAAATPAPPSYEAALQASAPDESLPSSPATFPGHQLDALLQIVSALDQVVPFPRGGAAAEGAAAAAGAAAEGTLVDHQRTVVSPIDARGHLSPSGVVHLLRRTFQFVQESRVTSDAEGEHQDRGSDGAAGEERTSPAPPHHMISFQRFRAGDVALFLPLPRSSKEQWVYLAFNSNVPRHYLARESAQYFYEKTGNKYPDYILGKIILIDEAVAGPRGDAATNPYNIREGSKYWVLHIHSIDL